MTTEELRAYCLHLHKVHDPDRELFIAEAAYHTARLADATEKLAQRMDSIYNHLGILVELVDRRIPEPGK